VRRRLVLAALAAMLVVALADRPVNSHLRAAALLAHLAQPAARSLLLPSAYELEEQDLAVPGPEGKPIAARLYCPVGIERPPGMVLLHGIHQLGIRDPRLMGFALALAGSGSIVLTPELEALTEYRVDASGVDVIGAAALDLAGSTPAGWRARSGVGVRRPESAARAR
jgi:acetyl esterase/lipase